MEDRAPRAVAGPGEAAAIRRTAVHEAALSIFSDADKFLASTPLTFLLATLPVLIFGPGRFSVDDLLAKFYWRTAAENPDGGK